MLKVNLLAYWVERGISPRRFSNIDLVDPSIDFALIARGYGANGNTVADPAALRSAVERAVADGGVHVIDARVSGSVDDEIQARFDAAHDRDHY